MRKFNTYQQTSEDINAVEITRNSKGEITFSVKVFNESIAKAKDRAIAVFDELQSYYKRVNNGTKPDIKQGCSDQPASDSN